MILKTWNYKLVIYVLCISIVTQMGSCSPYTRKKDTEDGRIQNLHISEQMIPPTFPDKQPDVLKPLLTSLRPQNNNRNLRFIGHIKTASTKISTSSKFHQLISNMLSHVKHKRTVIKVHRKEENRKRLFNLVNSLIKPGDGNVDMKFNTQRKSKNSDVHSHHRNKRDVSNINLTLNTTLNVLTEEQEREETLPVEWTAAGNYSAVWLVWKKYNQEKELARESQVAFMCVVFLLSMLSWAVWCTGMCNVKKITYREWTFQSSHDTLTVPEVMRKRWKYLPDESFYEEVIVHDRGTDP